jgi:hypothetical protein
VRSSSRGVHRESVHPDRLAVRVVNLETLPANRSGCAKLAAEEVRRSRTTERRQGADFQLAKTADSEMAIDRGVRSLVPQPSLSTSTGSEMLARALVNVPPGA